MPTMRLFSSNEPVDIDQRDDVSDGSDTPPTVEPSNAAISHFAGFNETCNRLRAFTAATVSAGVGKVFNNAIAPAIVDAAPSQRRCNDKLSPCKTTDGAQTVQVQPVLVRKTPKFPSRERHMAIRRKKGLPKVAPLPWTVSKTITGDSKRNNNSNASTCCCMNKHDHVHVETSLFQSNSTSYWAPDDDDDFSEFETPIHTPAVQKEHSCRE